MLRVLLVEDEPDVALVAATVLEDAGYHVTAAADGHAGLGIALQEQPELVITDFMMPRLSGLEMIARLREAGFAQPIILTSAIPEEHLPPTAFGYDAFLPKPYRIGQLLALVGSFRTGA
ncbi:response regulator [Fulvimonas yonginensis]|uniref:Response regulator n=1 Tax=Fulvimonas yonginensis TaxID=1495200 RepID=A0ABU8JCT2_9GAMM